MLAGTGLAVAILIALAASGCQTTAPAGGESISATEADLSRITGFPIKVHASSRMVMDPSLPHICQAVTDAFRSAAKDPETSKHLGPMVHTVEIQDWPSATENYHAVVYKEVLTIQTLPGATDVGPLRSLTAGVLKKAAQAVAAPKQ
jgi:hypothetical protein